MANKCVLLTGAFFVFAVVLTSVVLFAVSWKILEPNEWGLDYDANTETIDRTKLYESGRYLLGLNHKFLKFPKTLQTVRFSESEALPTRTFDGLLISLEVSFQFKLVGTLPSLLALYEDYGLGYLPVIQKISRDAIRDVCSDFSAYSFFANRTEIQNAIQIELVRVMETQHATIESFQLLNVALPTELDEAIQVTQISRQAVAEAQFAQRSAQIEADTRVLKAQRDAQVILLNANATANSIVEQANAQAASITAAYAAEGAAYSALATSLGFTADETIAYFFSSAIRDSDAEMYVGVNTPGPNKVS